MLHIPLYYIVWSNLCYMGCSWWWCMSSASCILLTLLLITNQIFLTLSIYLIFPFQIKNHEFVWLKTLWCKTLHNLVLFLYIFPLGSVWMLRNLNSEIQGLIYGFTCNYNSIEVVSYSFLFKNSQHFCLYVFALEILYWWRDVSSSKGLLPSKRIFLHLCVLWERS